MKQRIFINCYKIALLNWLKENAVEIIDGPFGPTYELPDVETENPPPSEYGFYIWIEDIPYHSPDVLPDPVDSRIYWDVIKERLQILGGIVFPAVPSSTVIRPKTELLLKEGEDRCTINKGG